MKTVNLFLVSHCKKKSRPYASGEESCLSSEWVTYIYLPFNLQETNSAQHDKTDILVGSC